VVSSLRRLHLLPHHGEKIVSEDVRVPSLTDHLKSRTSQLAPRLIAESKPSPNVGCKIQAARLNDAGHAVGFQHQILPCRIEASACYNSGTGTVKSVNPKNMGKDMGFLGNQRSGIEALSLLPSFLDALVHRGDSHVSGAPGTNPLPLGLLHVIPFVPDLSRVTTRRFPLLRVPPKKKMITIEGRTPFFVAYFTGSPRSNRCPTTVFLCDVQLVKHSSKPFEFVDGVKLERLLARL
jgi:hypothetical protein